MTSLTFSGKIPCLEFDYFFFYSCISSSFDSLSEMVGQKVAGVQIPHLSLLIEIPGLIQNQTFSLTYL